MVLSSGDHCIYTILYLDSLLGRVFPRVILSSLSGPGEVGRGDAGRGVDGLGDEGREVLVWSVSVALARSADRVRVSPAG